MTKGKGARPCKSRAWSAYPPFFKACRNYAMGNADLCRRHAFLNQEDSLLYSLRD